MIFLNAHYTSNTILTYLYHFLTSWNTMKINSIELFGCGGGGKGGRINAHSAVQSRFLCLRPVHFLGVKLKKDRIFTLAGIVLLFLELVQIKLLFNGEIARRKKLSMRSFCLAVCHAPVIGPRRMCQNCTALILLQHILVAYFIFLMFF